MPAPTPQRQRKQARPAAGSWTFDLPREEQKATLSVSLPSSLINDIELLKNHFGAERSSIVEKILRVALDRNADLASLKAQQAQEPAATPTATPVVVPASAKAAQSAA